MEMTYQTVGTNTYLTIRVDEQDYLDSMSLGMLTNNKIPGFAPASFTQMDATKYIQYNVTSKATAAQLFSGPVNKKRLLGVFSGIVNAMLSAEEYMIDPSTILLDMDYIFTDVSTCDTILICLPVMQAERKNVDLSTFFKNIIFRTQFDQTENCDHVAQIINYLNSVPVLSLADFKGVLDNIAGVVPQPARTAAPQPVQPVVQQPQVQRFAPQPAAAPQPAQTFVSQPVQPQAPVNPQPYGYAPVQQPAAQGFKTLAKPQGNPAVNPYGGFAVPGKQPAAFGQKAAQPVARPGTYPGAYPGAQPAPAAPAGGKEISFMYLMQHYNKENAAAYKAQQAAKKAQKEAAPKPDKKAAKKQKGAVAAVPAGFAVPGQPVPTPGAQRPVGYAVPGQNVPAGYTVPGQNVPAVGGQRPVGYPMPGQPAPVPPAQQSFAPVQQKVQPVQQPVAQAPYQQPAQNPVQRPAYQRQPVSFGDTTVLDGGFSGQTTVLGAVSAAEPQIKPHLIRLKNNERVNVDKPVFRIGKEKSYVDYFISDNSAISRSHANIVTKGGEYFIVDTNSTNHTYVNGGMIQSNVETKIAHDTKLRLANEEFVFKLY